MEAKRKLKRRRRTFWDAKADAHFVDLWGQKVDDLRGSRKNKFVYEEIAADFATQGFNLSPQDVKYKIANLTAKYKKYKEAIESGEDPPPTDWPLFEEVHNVVTSYRLNKFDMIVEESYEEPSMMEPPVTLEDLLAPSFEKLISMGEDFGKHFKKSTDNQQEMLKEILRIENENLKVLKDIRDDNKKLTNAILSYINKLK